MQKALFLLGFVSPILAEQSIGLGTGVQFPIVQAPEPSGLITLAFYLLALVAFVMVVRRKRSPAGR